MSTLPFYYQRVEDSAERHRFVDNYRLVSGNDLSEEYLQKAIVFQFYRGPKPIAGFVLNVTELHPLRYFSYLDQSVRDQLLLEEDLLQEDCLEITANYKLRQALSPHESQIYYAVMLNQAYHYAQQFGKTVVIGGSVIKAVKKLQQRLMDRVLYHGPIRATLTTAVKAHQPLLKIYAIERKRLLRKATLTLWQRYTVSGWLQAYHQLRHKLLPASNPTIHRPTANQAVPPPVTRNF